MSLDTEQCKNCKRTFPAELVGNYALPLKPPARIQTQIRACPICVSELTRERLGLEEPYRFPDNPDMQKKLAYAEKLVAGENVPVEVAPDVDSMPEQADEPGEVEAEQTDLTDEAEPVVEPDEETEQELIDSGEVELDEEAPDETEEDEAEDMLDRKPSDAPASRTRRRGKNK